MLSKRFYKTKSSAEITFEHACDHTTMLTKADTVELIGEFNNWLPIKMKYSKKYKLFRAKVRLPKDKTFHFRYRINNQDWHNEHQADAYTANPFGSDNSIISTIKEKHN